ncbi:MAG TPA: T9SS type A sorting domain-containing protein, partial [bacterium]|nr:T9SS type A sorting domain-containing protein [bacterium]
KGFNSLGRGTATPVITPTITPSPTQTPSPTPDAAAFAIAAPNVSKGGEPIKFLVNLNQPSTIDLVLFNVSGEKIFETSLQGNSGWNSLPWNLENRLGGQVASGLYFYRIEATGAAAVSTRMGKVAVLH